MSFNIDSAGARDAQAVAADTNFVQASATYLVTATPGAHTFSATYRVEGGPAATFANRTITVVPMP
jgi:hypothetical protein